MKDNEIRCLGDEVRKHKKKILETEWESVAVDALFRCPECGRVWGYRNHITFNGRNRCPDCGCPFKKPRIISDETLELCMKVKENDSA